MITARSYSIERKLLQSASKLTTQLSFGRNGQNLGKTSARISVLQLWFQIRQRRHGYAQPLSRPHITWEKWRTHAAVSRDVSAPPWEELSKPVPYKFISCEKGYSQELPHESSECKWRPSKMLSVRQNMRDRDRTAHGVLTIENHMTSRKIVT